MKRLPVARTLLVGISLALAGCPHPLFAPATTQSQSLSALQGTVSFGAARTTQATMTEVASGATVSLIDPATGNTVASTVTGSTGAFSLNFGSAFRPGSSAYYLEAVKGLQAGGPQNRAGASAARVRTLIAFQSNAWVSLTGSAITIDRATTALCVIASLQPNAVVPASLLNTLTPSSNETLNWTRTPTAPAGYAATTADAFNSASTNIAPQDYHLVFGLVDQALQADQDPLFNVGYDRTLNQYTRDTQLFNVSSVVPAGGVTGSTISINGHNFDPNPYNTQVLFNGVPGVINAVSGDRSQLTVTVPNGAYTGPLTIENGNLRVVQGGFSVANSPTAGTTFYAIDPSGDSDDYLRLIATQPNTNVTIYAIATNGTVSSSKVTTLATAGQIYENFLPQTGTAQMYKIVADRPIMASYDDIATQHGSDDDIASVSGTDYYFRQPAGSFTSTDEFEIISPTNGNAVTVTCLQNSAFNASKTLNQGQEYRSIIATTSLATAANSYVFHVTSSAPTVTTYGYSNDNNATQVPSAYGDGKQFYTANRSNGTSGAGYYLVGYQNGTTATLTNLASNTSSTYALNAGSSQFVGVSTTGPIDYAASASNPIGLYFTDALSGYDGTQHMSADNPNGIGSNYYILPPAKDTSTVYIASTTPGNTVTLSGGITGTYSLGKDAWFNAGGLSTLLSIRSTYPIAVFTISSSPQELDYTLLPAWPGN